MVLTEMTNPIADEFRPPETISETAARIHRSSQSALHNGACELKFQALGSPCRVTFAASPNHSLELQKLVLDWVAAFESKYSRYLPGSLISQINTAAGIHPVPIDADTERLFALCDQLHFMTRGVFDPSALPLLKVWSWKRREIPTDTDIASALRLVGWRKVQRQPGQIYLPEPGMGIDLGGMGKEYAVDSIAQLLATHGANSILVDFGADVRVIGAPADGRPGWHIGLDDPRNAGKCWAGLGVRDSAVATSGDYVRRFEAKGRRYSHIIDIRAGQPVQNECRAVSVLAPSCTQAGMVSTAAFILGPREGMTLLEMPGVAGAIVTETNVQASRRFYEYVVS